ncbi:MAG: MerR family transcriptional regulator [Alicyclobacillus sp.]|nr:MerR family transcriptional regulator [Alicyclobacillus sp.]
MDLQERQRLPLFPMRTVQALTGLTARQIRYYEQHEIIQPARSEGKQRLFSFADVERLLEVRRLLDEGYNMAGVKAKLAKRPEQGRTAIRPKAEPSDAQVYQWLQKELSEGQASSIFQGDLSRFYRGPGGKYAPK